jgi:hypothetical protein
MRKIFGRSQSLNAARSQLLPGACLGQELPPGQWLTLMDEDAVQPSSISISIVPTRCLLNRSRTLVRCWRARHRTPSPPGRVAAYGGGVLPHSGRSLVQNLGAGAGAWRPLTSEEGSLVKCSDGVYGQHRSLFTIVSFLRHRSFDFFLLARCHSRAIPQCRQFVAKPARAREPAADGPVALLRAVHIPRTVGLACLDEGAADVFLA